MSDDKTTLSAETIRDLIELRRDLHMHPELGTCEVRTAAQIAQRMHAAGLTVEEGVAGTGVIATLDSGRPGATVGYRADMDALPIDEANDVPYRSQQAGVMHACGHDVHTTIAAGIAELLATRAERLSGRFVFVFQPNEEGAPGSGPSGGNAMVEAGVIERHAIEKMFALHCMPSLDVGHLGFTQRAVWAGSDRFLVTLRGTQTHGAYPHLGVDPIVAGARMIVALQQISSQVIDAQHA